MRLTIRPCHPTDGLNRFGSMCSRAPPGKSRPARRYGVFGTAGDCARRIVYRLINCCAMAHILTSGCSQTSEREHSHTFLAMDTWHAGSPARGAALPASCRIGHAVIGLRLHSRRAVPNSDSRGCPSVPSGPRCHAPFGKRSTGAAAAAFVPAPSPMPGTRRRRAIGSGQADFCLYFNVAQCSQIRHN